MSDEYKYIHLATSYAIKAEELYYGFPTRKYITSLSKEKVQEINDMDMKFRGLYGRMFRYLMYLIIKDIILNKTIFKMPPGANRTWIQMDAITNDDFVRAYQNGAFQDVDYLASNFTGYQLYLRYNTRYGNWKKHIHVSKKYKDIITQKTNAGEGW